MPPSAGTSSVDGWPAQPLDEDQVPMRLPWRPGVLGLDFGFSPNEVTSWPATRRNSGALVQTLALAVPESPERGSAGAHRVLANAWREWRTVFVAGAAYRE